MDYRIDIDPKDRKTVELAYRKTFTNLEDRGINPKAVLSFNGNSIDVEVRALSTIRDYLREARVHFAINPINHF